VHASVYPEVRQPFRRGGGDLPTRHYMVRNMSNDYEVDRRKQRTETFTGILGVDEQDSAIQEGMGALIDRTEEHLGTTDVGIIRMRRMLLRAADEMRASGALPYSATHGDVYNVRAGHVVLPADASWVDHPAAVAAVTP